MKVKKIAETTSISGGKIIDSPDGNSVEDTFSQRIINEKLEQMEAKKVLLWKNPKPTSAFVGQTITLDEEKSKDCDMYKVIYKMVDNTDFWGSVEFPKGHGSFIESATIVNRMESCSRMILSSSDSEVRFASAMTPEGKAINDALIPYYIFGYNTGLGLFREE